MQAGCKRIKEPSQHLRKAVRYRNALHQNAAIRTNAQLPQTSAPINTVRLQAAKQQVTTGPMLNVNRPSRCKDNPSPILRQGIQNLKQAKSLPALHYAAPGKLQGRQKTLHLNSSRQLLRNKDLYSLRQLPEHSARQPLRLRLTESSPVSRATHRQAGQATPDRLRRPQEAYRLRLRNHRQPTPLRVAPARHPQGLQARVCQHPQGAAVLLHQVLQVQAFHLLREAAARLPQDLQARVFLLPLALAEVDLHQVLHQVDLHQAGLHQVLLPDRRAEVADKRYIFTT